MALQIPTPEINIAITSSYENNGFYAKPLITINISNPLEIGTLYYRIKMTFKTQTGSPVIRQVPASGTGYVNTSAYTVSIQDGIVLDNQPLINVQVSAYIKYISNVSDISVAELTESGRIARFNIVTNFKKNTCTEAYLKAFMNIPTESNLKYYATWEQTKDGVYFENVPYLTGTINVRVLKEEFVNIDLEDITTASYKTVQFKEFQAPEEEFSEFNKIVDRMDVLRIPPIPSEVPEVLPFVDNTSYRYKVITVREITSEDPAFVEGGSATQYKQDLQLGQYLYTPLFTDDFEFPYNPLGNSVMGNKLYSRKSVYSYGHSEFKNNIFVSEAGSFITPLLNAADLDTQDDSEVTVVLPWRDYVLASTEKALYILIKQENGFLIKTVSTAIGIPAKDKDTCKSILNGIIFKSGNKIYTLYPNMYSSDDSMLNMGDISKPIENILLENDPHESYNSFAISTETEYILFIPQKYSDNNPETFCYKYNYSRKMWTFSTYPAVINDYEMFSVDDIRLFGYSYKDDVKTYSEYIYGKDLKEAYPEIDISNIPYGDILTAIKTVPEDMETWGTEADVTSIKPIEFMFDSGQRTNNISFTKQFTETKFIVATEHEKDSFPFEINVFIDGNQFPHKTDISTDAGFWRNSSNQNLILGGAAQPDSAVKTLRQVFFRYSGKGKSIRHVVKGKSLYKFKIYEIYYRFKNLNVKQ